MNELRQLEKLGYKTGKLKLDVKYLETCHDLGICPEFLKFKPPNLKVYASSKDLFITILLKKLKEVKSSLSKTERKFVIQKSKIFSRLSLIERLCLIFILNDWYNKNLNITLMKQRRKLMNLWIKQRDKSPDCIKNYSKRQLTVTEEAALRYGLNHHILPKNFDNNTIKASIEQLAFSIKKNENIKFDEEISDEIKFALKRFSTSAKRICFSHRNCVLHKTLKNLSKDNEIKICKFDKGKGIAILDSSDYYSKLDSIALDQSKFIQINQNIKVHPIISKEKSVTYFIRKYLKNYDSEVIRKLISSGSKPGRIYGLVKLHKNNYPLCLVISMIDLPEYELAKFMDFLIKPLVPNKYMLSSTDDFLMKLNNSNISSDDKLVSFDVVSLFTNIPLNETINIIADYVFSDENIQKPLMEKHIFVKLLRLACERLFFYKDCLYQQIDGVAMGYVQLVQDMYEGSETAVRCAVGTTESFKVKVGLHQGSALSPFLFAVIMDRLTDEVRREPPWTMLFADDIVICEETREEVERRLESWKYALERRGMKVSRSKTEYLCINGGNDDETVKMEDAKVPRVKEFKYLGSTVQESGGCEREVKKRVQAGWNGWRRVSGVICDRRLPARVKGKVYSSMVRPAMVYGLETVAVTKKQVEEMEVAEMKMLRFAMGVTRKDKIRNEHIRSTVKVEQLGMKMREGRLRWYGHVMRRDQEYVGRKMMEMELPGKRRRGRPKRRFLDAVKEDMQEVGVKETDVEDRKMWRMMIRCGHP